jgi:xanthine dehydrogenase accessory factor
VKTAEERVFENVLVWLQAGQPVWLCTIVSTMGASPRPLGSLLGMNGCGELVGSLSGGCVEDDLLDKIKNGALVVKQPVIELFGVSAEENERLGLPCGGRLEVLVEHLQATHTDQVQSLLAALAQRQCIRRRVDLSSGRWRLETVAGAEILALDSQTMRQDFGPRLHLLLVGANELARCIAELATAMDYAVSVCDPREDRLAQWSVAGVNKLRAMPDDAVREHADDGHSLVITLTHDPRIDDMALMEALQSRACYVGALGSERTSAKRRLRLLQLDLTEAQISRLHAPVGLPIGSKSAMEIAVAVMAQLIQRRTASR